MGPSGRGVKLGKSTKGATADTDPLKEVNAHETGVGINEVRSNETPQWTTGPGSRTGGWTGEKWPAIRSAMTLPGIPTWGL